MRNKNLNHIKTTGFTVPKDYLYQLERELHAHIIEDDLKNQHIKHGLKVPENYFKQVDAEILSKVKQQKPKVRLFHNSFYAYAVAIAAVLVLYFSIFNTTTENKNEALTAELIKDYLISTDLDAYDIAEILNEPELLEDHIVADPYDKDQLENYIIENINLENIIE